MSIIPKFFVAMTTGDTIASLDTHQDQLNVDKVKSTRVSALYFYPPTVKQYLLFSRSFDSTIHYNYLRNQEANWHDPQYTDTSAFGNSTIGNPNQAKEMFADCGAFQYKDDAVDKAMISFKSTNGIESLPVSAINVMKFYEKEHLNEENMKHWDRIMLCSPDHIVFPDGQDDVQARLDFNQRAAQEFLQLVKPYPKVVPVAVIHGTTKAERRAQYDSFIEMGYKYIAFGGMVPLSAQKEVILDLLTDCTDMDNPVIKKSSILYHAKENAIEIHMFGLCSPLWCQWWYRLGVHSFDGSKIANEGAMNGWYWVPRDNEDPMDARTQKLENRNPLAQPTSLQDLYFKINVKKMAATYWEKICKNIDALNVGEMPYHQILLTLQNAIQNTDGQENALKEWDWLKNESGLLQSKVGTLQIKRKKQSIATDTSCACPACQYFQSSRCPSDRCWMFKGFHQQIRHNADLRMSGSTEHNMGRAVHNAYVYAWLLEQLPKYMTLANAHQSEIPEWLKNWRSVPLEQEQSDEPEAILELTPPSAHT